jgi:hypothetical protein
MAEVVLVWVDGAQKELGGTGELFSLDCAKTGVSPYRLYDWKSFLGRLMFWLYAPLIGEVEYAVKGTRSSYIVRVMEYPPVA